VEPLSDLQLLASEHQTLIEHANAIRARESWASVLILRSGVSLANFGGGVLTLGALLTLWEAHRWAFEAEDGSGVLRIVHFGGNPLSSSHGAFGFDETGTLSKFKLPRGTRVSTVGAPALRLAVRENNRLSGWSLGQILHELGAEQDDLPIQSPNRETIATWSHRSRSLLDPSGEVIVVLTENQLNRTANANLSQDIFPPSTTVVIAPDLVTGPEPWRGSSEILQLSNGTTALLGDRDLCDSDGVRLATFDRPPPPGAARVLADQLTRPSSPNEKRTSS